MMKLAIIGAGPAGIFATKFLKDWEGEIHLFEANEHIGKKLALTGGGRMNLTNKNLDVSHFFSENERALKHIFKNGFARNYLDLFDELEIKMKWEHNRALLKSEDAAKQVKKWETEFQQQKNLTLHLNSEVKLITKFGDNFLIKDMHMWKKFSTL
jgi:predicted flavoprotein YhiN